MEISLDIRKSIEENAASYFEKAKKEKKKLEGTRKIIKEYTEKLNSLIEEAEQADKKSVLGGKKTPLRKEWYEKFRWFFSSDNYLVIGGRDATTNELVIKKHAEPEDLVFHTEMPGSPFVVVKNKNQGYKDSLDIPESTLQEAAVFTAIFSKAWKQGLAGMKVFCVKPNQLSKTPRSGEFIARGAFMIYGEKKFYNAAMSCAVGIYNDKPMVGPLSAVKKHCKEYVELVQSGESGEKPSDVAKAINKLLGGNLELDTIIRTLPPNCKVKKESVK